MKIETYVNFKLRTGKKMLAGIYDDHSEPFPDEIYEEIDRNRNTPDRRRWTLRILDESAASSASSIDDANPENMTTQDDNTNVVDTSSKTKKKKRSRKRKEKDE